MKYFLQKMGKDVNIFETKHHLNAYGGKEEYFISKLKDTFRSNDYCYVKDAPSEWLNLLSKIEINDNLFDLRIRIQNERRD